MLLMIIIIIVIMMMMSLHLSVYHNVIYTDMTKKLPNALHINSLKSGGMSTNYIARRVPASIYNAYRPP